MLKSYLVRVFRAAEEDNRRNIIEAVDYLPNERLLDLGCGNGAFTLQLAETTGVREVHGIEFVAEPATEAARRGIQVWRGDLNEPFPYPDGHFGLVHGNQVIEHVRHTDHLLRESKRVLQPRGMLLVSTNNLASWHNIGALMLGWQPLPAHVSDETLIGNPLDPYHGTTYDRPGQTHLRLFTARALRDLARFHGFFVETVKGTGYYPLPLSLARVLARADPRHAAFLVLIARRPDN